VITSVIVSLSGERSWDPAYLTASAFRWPGRDSRTTAVGDLATTQIPDGWVDHDVPVITPGGLDPVGGGLRRRSRKYRGAVYQVRSSERGLRPGDLLVPLTPEPPALLVRPDLAGSMVSSAFLALRPREGFGLWLWAILSSRSGRTVRSHLAANAFGRANTRAALLELHVPLPPVQEQRRLGEQLSLIELHTHRPEEEAAETWWRMADLRGSDWQLQLVTPNPTVLHDGVPLSDLCAQIVRGRPVPKEAISDRPAPDHLPLTDISVTDGKPVRRWVAPGPKPPIVAYPGDILVAAVGNRPHASLVRENTAVDRNLWLLRLLDADQGPGLVRYLNGETGYGVRQLLLTGKFIPGLRKDNLSALPVAPEALEGIEPGEPLVPLDLQLEQALWS
jgi:hypothetical protein